jgi:hypothetical protein
VRVKIMEGRTDALVTYRNRVQELCVPSIDSLPVWNTVETWRPPAAPDAPLASSTGGPS